MLGITRSEFALKLRKLQGLSLPRLPLTVLDLNLYF